MLVNADIYVKDVPGQLIEALEPLSTVDANIIGIVHSREQTISGRIAVNLTFDIEQNMIKRLKEMWKKKDVIVARIGSAIDICNLEFVIVGNMNASIVDDVISSCEERIEILSKNMKISFNNSGRNSCMVTLGVKDEESLASLDKYVSEECRRRDLLYVRGV